MNRKHKLLLALLLWIVALGFRLHGISTVSPHSDEQHWQKRGGLVLKNIRTRNWQDLTTHLLHPGVPTAYVVAASQWTSEKYNSHLNFSPRDKYYLAPLVASRIGCAIFASLIAPIVFLGFHSLLGLSVSLFAASILALDFPLAENSRFALMDAMLVVFITTSIIFYAHALKSRSLLLKLMAGIFWGLSVSIKPTSVFLIPAFLAWRAFRFLFFRTRNYPGDNKLITWGDLWAVVLGHAAFAAVYTRLWYHWTTEPYKLNNPSLLREATHNIGRFFSSHSSLAFTLIGFFSLATLALLGSFLLNRKSAKDFSAANHVGMLCLLMTFLLGILTQRPAILENIIGYWTWTFNLSKERHESFGQVWEPLPLGYLGEFLFKTPSVFVFGILLTAFPLWRCWKKRGLAFEQEQLATAALLVICFCFWLAPLSMSQKQAYRYAIPVLPCYYLIAAFGLLETINLLIQKTAFGKFTGRISFATAAALLLIPWSYSFASIGGRYELYSNTLSGGIQKATVRGERIPFTGQKKVLEFLHNRASLGKGKLTVMVLGDHLAMKQAYVHFFPEILTTGTPLLHFIPFHPCSHGFHVLSFTSTEQRTLRTDPDALDKHTIIYEDAFDGIPLARIFEPIPPLPNDPLVYRLDKHPRISADLIKISDALKVTWDTMSKNQSHVLISLPGKQVKGHAAFGAQAKLAPGSYTARYFLALPLGHLPKSSLGPEQHVLQLEFTSKCIRQVTLGELENGIPKAFDVHCSFEQAVQANMRVYWFGTVPAVIAGLELHVADAH